MNEPEITAAPADFKRERIEYVPPLEPVENRQFRRAKKAIYRKAMKEHLRAVRRGQ